MKELLNSQTFSVGSDNHSGIHPDILKAITEVNVGHTHSYGLDPISRMADQHFKATFGEDASSFYVFNGTAANVLCLKSLVQSHHLVACSDMSHLHMDECGAPEATVGCKLLTLASPDGKLTPQMIDSAWIRRGDQHYSQLKAVSITQPTEVGTVYSLEELRQLKDYCKVNKLALHIDGARLIYAANYLGCTLKDLVTGCDALSFGGTKNGLLFGEAVVLFNPRAKEDFKYIRKQCMQLPSKMRFISGQFAALLRRNEDGECLWESIARTGHEKARYLAEKIQNLSEVEITQKVEANSVFAIVPKSWIKPLKKHSFFYVWDEKKWEVRWMMSFDTSFESIDAFVSKIKQLS